MVMGRLGPCYRSAVKLWGPDSVPGRIVGGLSLMARLLLGPFRAASSAG
jgi:hypothetical protein